MLNIKKVSLLQCSFKKQKESCLRDMALLAEKMAKKMAAIQRMRGYLAEYVQSKTLTLTAVMPALNKNFHHFLGKIEKLIVTTEQELLQLENHRAELLMHLQKVNSRMHAMEHMEDTLLQAQQKKAAKYEAVLLDDRVSYVKGERDGG